RLEVSGEAVPLTSVSWTVLAPPGWQLVSTTALSRALAMTHRAAALVDFARQLGPEVRSRLSGPLHDALREAEQAQAAAPAAAGEPGPEGLTLGEWLERLRAAAPAADRRSNPDFVGPYDVAFERGTPYYWHTSDGSPPDVRRERDGPDLPARLSASAVLAAVLLIGTLL